MRTSFAVPGVVIEIGQSTQLVDPGGTHDGIALRESILHLENLSKAFGLDLTAW